ncbi:hypothetical protein PO124_03480 [Bacillus licheniformis]|nr:hypothetical protein [Bacillus licheniformis]
MMTIIVMVDVFKETNSVFGSGLVWLYPRSAVYSERSLLCYSASRSAANSGLVNMVQSGLCIMHRLMPIAWLTLLYHLSAAILQSFVGSWYTPAQLGLLYQAIKSAITWLHREAS